MMIYPWWKFGVCHQELIMNMISPIHTISASCISVPIDVLTISTELLMTSPASQMTGPIPCGKQINHGCDTTHRCPISKYTYAKVRVPQSKSQKMIYNNQYTQKSLKSINLLSQNHYESTQKWLKLYLLLLTWPICTELERSRGHRQQPF